MDIVLDVVLIGVLCRVVRVEGFVIGVVEDIILVFGMLVRCCVMVFVICCIMVLMMFGEIGSFWLEGLVECVEFGG